MRIELSVRLAQFCLKLSAAEQVAENRQIAAEIQARIPSKRVACESAKGIVFVEMKKRQPTGRAAWQLILVECFARLVHDLAAIPTLLNSSRCGRGTRSRADCENNACRLPESA
ncbi:hypothetical protein HUU39_20595 [candidate division KSB1 bacterium]|nr:hypothetical protein [bacterium]NUM67633.1 hypothetical protein [candidate division KSB1 bacterium]